MSVSRIPEDLDLEEAIASGEEPEGAEEIAGAGAFRPGAEGSVEPGGKGALLDIALDWQDHPLSCEAASLKMALAGKGIKITEGEIMEEIGFDPTLHEQSIWGDPYRAFVGDIDGKMCSTGYGVYWEPTAEAALKWRPAEFFSDWSLDNLIREIKSGNPVVVWGKLDVEQLTDCSWFTSEGKYIKAYKETHVRLVVGFTGPAENPENIIINDPLAGRLYWPTSYFLENWKVFGNWILGVRLPTWWRLGCRSLKVLVLGSFLWET